MIWPEASNNIAFTYDRGDMGTIEAAIRDAAHVVECELVNNRVVAAPLETRGALGTFDAASDRLHAAPLQAACAPADKESMQRLLAIAAAVAAALTLAGPAAAGRSSVAALQVALRAHGHYPAAVDGVDGPLKHAGLTTFQRRTGLPASGRVGRATRSALGALGRPLLGQRELGVGAVGWDVSSLVGTRPIRAQPGGRRRAVHE